RVARAGALVVDAARGVAELGGTRLRLQPREFELLFLLASHPGETLTREFLIENTSSYGRRVPTRSVDTHVKNLRRKLGRAGRMIVTAPKVGYRLEA
ncbi:MAG: winged helix-turn-helix transcriptional regulator, partial [Elusimicrobia bacterium]|nr:winged helix-turn-helix transcriptional regulator [Elusimicrobiota bacterium]